MLLLEYYGHLEYAVLKTATCVQLKSNSLVSKVTFKCSIDTCSHWLPLDSTERTSPSPQNASPRQYCSEGQQGTNLGVVLGFPIAHYIAHMLKFQVVITHIVLWCSPAGLEASGHAVHAQTCMLVHTRHAYVPLLSTHTLQTHMHVHTPAMQHAYTWVLTHTQDTHMHGHTQDTHTHGHRFVYTPRPSVTTASKDKMSL